MTDISKDRWRKQSLLKSLEWYLLFDWYFFKYNFTHTFDLLWYDRCFYAYFIHLWTGIFSPTTCTSELQPEGKGSSIMVIWEEDAVHPRWTTTDLLVNVKPTQRDGDSPLKEKVILLFHLTYLEKISFNLQRCATTPWCNF